MKIQLKKICKRINEDIILNNINLELDFDKVYLIHGDNGSGKTSLCRILSLLDKPTSGSIYFFDREFVFPRDNKLGMEFVYSKIGFVYQQLFLWPHITNEQNILLPFDKQRKLDNNFYNYLIQLLNLEEFLKKYPNEISKGQKQRVAIARALILKPQFIFLDEITSALDKKHIDNLLQIILDLKKQKIGMVIVTHDMSIYKEVADFRIELNKGSLVKICKIV